MYYGSNYSFLTYLCKLNHGVLCATFLQQMGSQQYLNNYKESYFDKIPLEIFLGIAEIWNPSQSAIPFVADLKLKSNFIHPCFIPFFITIFHSILHGQRHKRIICDTKSSTFVIEEATCIRQKIF